MINATRHTLIALALFAIGLSGLQGCGKKEDGKGEGPEAKGPNGGVPAKTEDGNPLLDPGMPAQWVKKNNPERDAQFEKQRLAQLAALVKKEEAIVQGFKKAAAENPPGQAGVLAQVPGPGFGSLARSVFSPAGDLLAWPEPEQKTVKVWDLPSNKLAQTLQNLPHGANIPVFSADGNYLAVAGYQVNDARVWEVKTGKVVFQFKLPTLERRMPSLGFSPDGKTLVMGLAPVPLFFDDPSLKENRDRLGPAIIMWDFPSGKKRLELAHFRPVGQHDTMSLRYSPDGQLLASAHNTGTAYVWDASSGKPLREISYAKKLSRGNLALTFTQLVWSPDGTSLAITGVRNDASNFVKLADLATGKDRSLWENKGEAQQGDIDHVDFTPDGRYLIVGFYFGRSGARELRAWDLKSGKDFKLLENVQGFSISPGGLMLAQGGSLWHLPSLLNAKRDKSK
jgi:WD40 repeat protein